MGEKSVSKEQWQEAYNMASGELKKIVKLCCIGWIMIFAGFAYSYFIVLLPVGFLIIALPMAIKWFRGGGLNALFFWKEYEVITTTTYSDGSVIKSSDGGMESFGLGMMFRAIMLVFVLAASCFLTLGKILYLIYICFISNKNISDKPITQSSIFKTILVGVIILIAVPIAVHPLSYLPIPGMSNSTYIPRINSGGEVGQWRYDGSNKTEKVYSKPNAVAGKVVFELSYRQHVQTTGRIAGKWTEIEYEGEKGWVFWYPTPPLAKADY